MSVITIVSTKGRKPNVRFVLPAVWTPPQPEPEPKVDPILESLEIEAFRREVLFASRRERQAWSEAKRRPDHARHHKGLRSFRTGRL
jgi:hypothetical protein